MWPPSDTAANWTAQNPVLGPFEEAFEIDIPDEDTEKIRTVQDAIDYIEKNAKK